MLPSAQGLDVPGSLAILLVLGTIAVSFYVARAIRRRSRRRERREGRLLVRLCRGFLRGQVGGEAVERAAASVEAGAFWAVIERLSVGPRAHLGRLSAALERNPHARAERRRLRDDSPWRRELAARRLGLLRSRASQRALRRALRRGPELVTLAAGTSLARYRDRAALRWLLAHPQALARRSRRAWFVLLAAYGRRGWPEVAAALERGMAHPAAELSAMDVLGQGRYRGARDRMERLLASGNLEQRVAAARALGALQAVEGATSLLAALHDPEWQVRAQAARALGRVRAPLAVEALSARLTDPAWWVRHHAAYALRELGPVGLDALRRVERGSSDPYARDMAREVLEGGVHFDAA